MVVTSIANSLGGGLSCISTTGSTTLTIPLTVTGANISGATIPLVQQGTTVITTLQATFVDADTISGTVTRSHVPGPGATTFSSGQVQGTFTFVATMRQPTVTGITPSTGPAIGGTTMTVTGANFNVSPFPTVRLGGVPAAVTSVNSAGTSLTAVTGASASSGVVDVTVTNPDGRSGVLPGGFTYLLAPNMLSVQAPGNGSGTVIFEGGGTSCHLRHHERCAGRRLQPDIRGRCDGVRDRHAGRRLEVSGLDRLSKREFESVLVFDDSVTPADNCAPD